MLEPNTALTTTNSHIRNHHSRVMRSINSTGDLIVALKRMAVEFGMGTDLRGEDYTKAACRALRDSLWHNSLTVCQALGYELNEMQVHIDIGVAKPDKIDTNAVKEILPYGNATVGVHKGGLDVDHPEHGRIVIANAAAIVYLDIN